ncbi:SpaA isopeptide-forming pilin-related protein [Enterococcus devriesei]|nr:SpaA isopeptide-forming pilin-related protein [Enterococcus devriesei]
MNKKKRLIGTMFLLLVLLLPMLSYWLDGETAKAEATTQQNHEINLFDTQRGKAQLSYEVKADQIMWKIEVEQQETEKENQLQLSLKSNGQPVTITNVKINAGEESYDIDSQTQQLVESSFSNKARHNELTFETKRLSEVTVFPSIIEKNLQGESTNLLADTQPIDLKIDESEQSSAPVLETTSSDTSNGSKTSTESTTSSTKDKVDLGEADDQTLAAEKKAAEKRFAATGKAQEITRSAAVASTGITVTKDNFLRYFNLLGSATFNQSSGIITLTPNRNNQVGNLTLKNKIDLNGDFIMDGAVNLGSDSNGADGISFGFHTGNTNTIGVAGGNLGIGGLENAIGFKLDTYKNDEAAPNPNATNAADQFGWAADVAKVTYPYGVFVTTSQKRILGKDGKLYSRWWAEPDASSAKSIGSSYMNGKFYPFKVSYSGSTKTLTVVFDNKFTWKRVIDAKEALSLVVSASTGGSKNLQQFQLNSFQFNPQGVINTKYVDQDTGKELTTGEQFSGTLESAKIPLVNWQTNQTLLDRGYVYTKTTTTTSSQYTADPYDSVTDPAKISPTNDNGIFSDQPLTVTYYYKKFSGTATLTKQNDNGKHLAGAHFDLRKKDGSTIAGKIDLVTDAKGQINVDGLNAGEYFFKEVKPPAGYRQLSDDQNNYPIVVSPTAANNSNSMTVSNQLKSFDVTLTTVDADNNKLPIANVAFELKDAKGNKIQTNTTGNDTNNDGKLSFANLSVGTYTLTETANENKDYLALKEPIIITIDQNGNVTVPNTLNLKTTLTDGTANNQVDFSIAEQAKVPLPATGGQGTWRYYLLGFMALTSSTIYLIFRRTRKEVA